MSRAKSDRQLGSLQPTIDAALREMSQTQVVARLWAKDHTLWKPEPTEIENRLGWLTVPEKMQERVDTLRAFAGSIRKAGFRHVVLLGMGGSSLGPEVLHRTMGSAPGYPRFWVLDSTVPGSIQEVTKAIQPARTLFLVASKSGGTTEVQALFAHFWDLVSRASGNTGGSQFIAITDPGTSLVSLAQERGFRTVFLNPPDIGGRYSVLSYFGLVPAALMGLNLNRLLSRACAMAQQCGPSIPPHRNPGAYLGAVMGLLGQAGRDKVTLLVSPKLRSFGLWVEQLLAESTGKEGQGLVPVADEPPVQPSAYGKDRLFVCLRLTGDANAQLDRQAKALEHAGHPIFRRSLRDVYDLAAEFFCWEFATAVAGHYLNIHPFDQPNVQESKENTGTILKELDTRGRLPKRGQAVPHRDQDVRGLLAKAAPGRYVAILGYVTPSPHIDRALAALRKAILTRHEVATTLGYGPRYLHSTGQLHKGGPDTGLFLQLVEDMTPDLPIPETPYTFGTLAQAQAMGDVQSLHAHHRPVVRIQLGRSPLAKLTALTRLAGRGVQPSRSAGSTSRRSTRPRSTRPRSIRRRHK
ncbi:MAG: glucose-6-phosphate isomerase [Nitrospirales bacterium]